MPTYVTITSTNDYVDTEFNALAVPADYVRSRWRKEELVSVYLKPSGAVGVRASNGMNDYLFCCTSQMVQGCTPVETVNGVAPTTNAELYTLIATCINPI